MSPIRYCVLTLLLLAGCSPQPEGAPPPSVIPVPEDVATARQLVQRIDESLDQWQSRRTDLVDYSGDGGEMVFWFSNETVRKIQATLPDKAVVAHWQVYYTSTQAPFFAVYAETRDGSQASTDVFAFLKDDALHVFEDSTGTGEPLVALEEVREFALQMVQSVHQL
ncbi:MAG: hypothetical protein AAFN78_07115 [Pseudomonadota bacterium]